MGFTGILVVLCGFYSLWWPFGWNWSYLGFLGIIWRTCGSICRGEGGGIFPFTGILVVLCGFYSLWWPFGWNWSYLGFLGIIWRTCGSICRGEGGGIFPTLCVECCLVISINTFPHCTLSKADISCSDNTELIIRFPLCLAPYLKWNTGFSLIYLTWFGRCVAVKFAIYISIMIISQLKIIWLWLILFMCSIQQWLWYDNDMSISFFSITIWFDNCEYRLVVSTIAFEHTEIWPILWAMLNGSWAASNDIWPTRADSSL